MVVPQNGWFIRKIQLTLMIWGYPYFRNLHMYIYIYLLYLSWDRISWDIFLGYGLKQENCWDDGDIIGYTGLEWIFLGFICNGTPNFHLREKDSWFSISRLIGTSPCLLITRQKQSFKDMTINMNQYRTSTNKACGSFFTVWEGTANALNHTPVPLPKKVQLDP